jgi:hypothetical protein
MAKKKNTRTPEEVLFYKHFSNVPVNIMDTPKIHKEISQLLKDSEAYAPTTGGPDDLEAYIEQGMQVIVAKYHKPY